MPVMKTMRRVLLIIVTLAMVVALLWAAVLALRPMPERAFGMATGPEGSAYRLYGERYKALLAKQGVTVTLVPSGGDLENLALLRDPDSGVSAAFVLSGTTTSDESPELESLGTMFYEPIWIFCRCDPDALDVEDVLGKHVSIGPGGSATHGLALRLMKLNGIDVGRMRIEEYPPERAAEELAAGRIDAAIVDTAWDSPAVQMMLGEQSVQLQGFARADAYVALLPYLNKVVLPAGVASLARNRPPHDVVMIAPKASLVVRDDLHPALQYLLIEAAMKIHGGPGVFNRAGAFPAAEMIDLPLSREAQHLYRSGPSFLRRHLPFWLAELVQRLLILAIPIAGLAFPLTRLLPEAWRWVMNRRLQGMYRELRRLELELRRTPPGPARNDLHGRLDALEARSATVRLPESIAGAPAYELKQNIRFVQEKYPR